MTGSGESLGAELEARCDQALGAAAAYLATKLFDILGEQAEVAVWEGRIYALHAAEPGAPPRRVTGNLQAHVGFSHLGSGDWVAGVRAGVPYAVPLETAMNHAFVSVVVEGSQDEIGAILAGTTGGG